MKITAKKDLDTFSMKYDGGTTRIETYSMKSLAINESGMESNFSIELSEKTLNLGGIVDTRLFVCVLACF